MSKRCILCDCSIDEIIDFKKGVEKGTCLEYDVISSISNGSHSGFLQNLARYAKYFSFPFLIFLKRKMFTDIIGWQQFYAINYAFFCRIFHVKKENRVIVANFTYKRKSGIIGRMYFYYMKYATSNCFVDFFHVPSYSFADELSEVLCIPREKFIVTPFGVSDNFAKYSALKSPFCGNYSLSIGRSNRDFDFIVEVWMEKGLENENLVIISDIWHPQLSLPHNIIHYSNIVGDESLSWFANCKLAITSIADGNICSGDTVLLTSMMLKKPTVITAPSTLSEMYVQDGINGVYIPKEKNKAAAILMNLLKDQDMLSRLGENARRSFKEKFSRESMGLAIAKEIK